MPTYVIHTSIEILADPQRVWDVLKDFDRYPEWNPCLLSIAGEKTVGSLLTISIDPAYFVNKRFDARLLEYSKEKGIKWIGQLRIPHMFGGTHSLEILPSPSGVTFVQREEFNGILVPFLKSILERKTKKGYEEMNRALKARSENVN
jgi:hypothetical protein